MGHDGFTAIAQSLIGEEKVTAAGVFAIRDNYKAITATGAAESLLMPAGADAATEMVGTAVAIEGARQANAAAHGVTERMLVAVTDSTIHVFAMSALGGKVEQELMNFPRATTDVEVKKFGLSRHLNLTDRASDRELHLTGSVGRLSRESEGDKAVLAAL